MFFAFRINQSSSDAGAIYERPPSYRHFQVVARVTVCLYSFSLKFNTCSPTSTILSNFLSFATFGI